MNGCPSYKILIVDEESAEIDGLIRLLKEHRNQPVRLDSFEEALNFLQKQTIDGVLFEPNLSDDRGRGFVDSLRRLRSFPSAAVIALTDEPDPDRRIELMEMEIDDLLLKPFHPLEAATRIDILLDRIRPPLVGRAAAEDGFSGSLAEMSVSDLLQTMMLAEKSAVIHLQHKSQTAQIVVQNGRVCSIQCTDNPTPIEALLNLLTWEEGRFSVEFGGERSNDHFDPSSIDRLHQVIKGIEAVRETAGEPFSPGAKYVLNSANIDRYLSQAERTIMLLFLEPTSIRRVLALSSLEEAETLRCIQSLFAKGLLLKTEEHRPTEEERHAFVLLKSDKTVGSKQRYSRIFSLFRLGAPFKRAGELIGPTAFADHKRLSKAELMLIRQKFSL